MQYLRILFENIRQNKLLSIFLIIFIVICIIGVFFSLYQKISDKERAYNDPLSGETVYNPTDRTPETYNQPLQITYLGFSELINRGASFESVQAFKDKIAPIKIAGKKITEVSIGIDSVQHILDTKDDIYEFNMRFNRKYDFKTSLKIDKNDETLTFNLSGDEIDLVTFN